jgi:putative copper resistance protein D
VQDIISVALRALSFVFVLQAAGIALFVALFAPLPAGSHAAICRLGGWAGLIAVVCVAGHYTLEAARMAGDLSGIWDLSLQRIELYSASGAAFLCQLLGLSLLAVGLRAGGKRSVLAALTGAVLALFAFPLTGHTSTHPERLLLGTLLLVHVLIVAFWFGGLLPLYMVSMREPERTTAALIERFSAWAIWLVPLILIAGVTLATQLVPNLAALAQPYGQLLLVKLGGFVVLMGLAAINKWQLVPALIRGEPSALTALRRSLIAEYVLIIGVLAVTAVMTTFFSPDM